MSAEVRRRSARTGGSADNSWVCPDDRQLALRAKLQTGWSVKTDSGLITRRPSGIDDGERDIIVNVIRKAETLEKNEQQRVGKLVDRLENMKRHALGNGLTSCILCGDKFGLIIGAKNRCHDCSKAVCGKCVVESTSVMRTQLLLCKICAESRELWKKSGAWFFSCMPHYQLPQRSTTCTSSGGGSGRAVGLGQRQLSTESPPCRYSWAKNIHTYKAERYSRTRLGGSTIDMTEPILSGRVRSMTSINERSAGSACSSEDDDVTMTSVRRVVTYGRLGTSLSTSAASVMARSSSSVDVSCQLDRPLQLKTPLKFSRVQQVTPTEPVIESSQSAVVTGVSDLPVNTMVQASPPAITRLGSSNSITSHSASLSDESSALSTTEHKTTGTLPSSIEFSLLLSSRSQSLECCVHRVVDIWPVYTDGLADAYVKIHLTPNAHKTNKLCTRSVSDSLNPVFNESLLYHNVTSQVVACSSLQLTVLDEDRYGHDVLGECRVSLNKLKHNEPQRFACSLLPVRSGRLGRSCSVYRGNLLLSLKYLSSRHVLLVGVVRCTALSCTDADGQVDAFAKVQLRPGNTKFCTTVKWRCTSAEFHEEFEIVCSRQQLARSVLDVRIYDKDIGRSNDLLGYVQLSIDSRGERLRHWFEALQYADTRHDRWHRLSTDQPPQLPL